MSLQVWLPLNGSLDNKGLSDVTVTNNGATVDNNGKIGKCYTFNNQYMTMPMTNLNTANGLTLACWIYPTANASGNTHLITFAPGAGWSYNRFGLFIRSDTTSVITTASDGTNAIYYSCQSSALPLNTWTHVCSTYSNRKLTVYLNGVQNITYNITFDISLNGIDSLNVGGCKNGNEKLANCKLNDVRFYNHCLSAKEVKEIYKGLVCHYKLSGCGGENYFVNSNDGTSFTSTENSTYADVRMIIDNDFWTKDNHDNYTVSFDWEISKPLSEITYCDLHWSNSPWYRLKTLVIPENTISGHYEYSGNNIPSEDYHANNIFVRLGSTSGTADSWLAKNPGITFKLKNYKLEIGSKSTPWCPNPSDALYSTLGYNDGIEYDCSGYGNNGTKVGNITRSNDSLRYSGSYDFNGTNYIKTNYSASMPELSCSFWAKPNSQNGGYAIIASNYNSPDSGFWIAINCEGSGLWFYNGAYVRADSLLSNDVWYHGCFTYNKGVAKWYLNGELVTTTDISSRGTSLTISNLSIGNSYTGSLWNTKFYGGISDFRLYATALSADDVKSLYNVYASIDKTGVLSAYEFVEEG